MCSFNLGDLAGTIAMCGLLNDSNKGIVLESCQQCQPLGVTGQLEHREEGK